METFHAGVFDLDKYSTLPQLCNYLKTQPTTLVLVSKPQKIKKEYRFFVHELEIITGSLYLIGEEQINEEVKSGYLWEYLSKVLSEVKWFPDPLYTVDVVETVTGELFILELGSYSCAGEYGCDLSKMIEVGAIAALQDYKDCYYQ